MELIRDFISKENRVFNIKFGNVLASALAGFIAGVVCTTIIFITVLYISGRLI